MSELQLTGDMLLLAALWLVYFAIHSLLASLKIKQYAHKHIPSLMPAYRLCFNFIATISLIPPLWVLYQGQNQPLWEFNGIALWVTHGIAILAILGFLYSLKYYDGQRFLGLQQWRNGEQTIEDQEQLSISPLHRYVRHPWYTFALMLIWTRSMNDLMLVTAILLSLYIVIGYRMEEKKLIACHGNTYKTYQSKVPGIIPLPWKFLTTRDARQIINS